MRTAKKAAQTQPVAVGSPRSVQLTRDEAKQVLKALAAYKHRRLTTGLVTGEIVEEHGDLMAAMEVMGRRL